MSNRPGRIVVVDDQENMCWILARILGERGHEVRTARSGQEALLALEGFACRLAIVDYRLPDMNGLDLIREMTHRLPRLRAILMTSYGTAALEEQVLKAQIYAYFNKPFVNDRMIETVELALDEEGTHSPAEGTHSPAEGTHSPTRFPGRGVLP